MRTFCTFFGLSFLAAFSLHAQQPVVLTPQTLAGWNITGTDAQTLSSQNELTLPAGTQLARNFASGNLSLRVSTFPMIGQSPEDWPVLELGSAALIFSRDASTGRLVLVLGEGAPVELPFTFPLNAEGRSVGPIAVVLERRDSSIDLTVSGQTLQFAADFTAKDPTQVVISSGSTQPWAFQSMELTIGAKGLATPDNFQAGSPQAKTDDARALPVGGMGAALRTENRLGQDLAGPHGQPGKSVPVRGGASGSLEIFTPPAVRYGRVDAARLTVARSNRL
jgi:hypothetical protein